MAKILIVDDEECIRLTFSEFLIKEGHEVDVAPDANRAVKALHEKKHDLLISDIILPKLTGTELLNIVSKEFPCLVTVLITGQPSMETASNAVRDGAFDYLCKPVSRDMLLDVVERALKRSGELNPGPPPEKNVLKESEPDEKLKLERTNWNLRKEISSEKKERKKIKSHRDLLKLLVQRRLHELREKDQQIEKNETERARIENEMAQLESRLIQAKKMEAIGRLSQSLSFDFNDLLSEIVSSINLALDDSSQHKKLYLKKAQRSADKANDLIKQLHIFSQEKEIKAESVNAVNIAQEVVALLGEAMDPGIVINLSSEKDISLIKGVPGEIYQILVNICQNSQDAILNAMGKKKVGGDKKFEIDISIENRRVDDLFCLGFPDSTPGKYVTITVIDNGIGMSEATRDMIFEPFFTTKKQSSGRGFGLAAVFSIVSKHGGWIELHSELGKGTSFRVFLPQAKVEPMVEKNRKSLSDKMAGGNETILLVDDEPMLLDVGKEVLERLGYRVFTAKDGFDSLRIVENQGDRIDIMVLDQTMPKMTGGEVLVKVRKTHPHLPCLIVSGSADDKQIKRFLDMGASRFVAKPYDLTELSQTVREVLDSVKTEKAITI